MKKTLLISFSSLATLILLLVPGIYIRHGGGGAFPVREIAPPPADAAPLEVVATLENPPGNIAVSSQGRIFFTFHPEAGPEMKLLELVQGKPVPYPDKNVQGGSDTPGYAGPELQTPLSLRIDSKNRLWVLDFAHHGAGQPAIYAFDLLTDKLVHQYNFPSEVAGVGSMLNDFHINRQATKIYIADASVFYNAGAIVVYDIEKKSARRLLSGHSSMQAEKFMPRIKGQDINVFGIFAVRPNIDSIALDTKGEYLYYAATTARFLYRIPTAALDNTGLSAEELAKQVEQFAPKTLSDGIIADSRDNIYITDFENFAVYRMGQDRKMYALVKDERLRWPDGLSIGPDGFLYITCSSLHHVIFKSAAHIKEHAPYHIFRVKLPD